MAKNGSANSKRISQKPLNTATGNHLYDKADNKAKVGALKTIGGGVAWGANAISLSFAAVSGNVPLAAMNAGGLSLSSSVASRGLDQYKEGRRGMGKARALDDLIARGQGKHPMAPYRQAPTPAQGAAGRRAESSPVNGRLGAADAQRFAAADGNYAAMQTASAQAPVSGLGSSGWSDQAHINAAISRGAQVLPYGGTPRDGKTAKG